MIREVFFDTETTGKDMENDRIIQLSGIVRTHEGEETSARVFNVFGNPGVPISIEAMSVHGIVPEKIEGKPAVGTTDTYKTIFGEGFVDDGDTYYIAHNAPFDLKMLERESGFSAPSGRVIDTLKVAKYLLYGVDDIQSFSLSYLFYYFKLYRKIYPQWVRYLGVDKQVKGSHDALFDSIALICLYDLFLKSKTIGGDLKLMVKMSEGPAPVEILRFGKYRNEKISDIAKKDSDYLRWMLRQMTDLDEDTRISIEVALGVTDAPDLWGKMGGYEVAESEDRSKVDEPTREDNKEEEKIVGNDKKKIENMEEAVND